MGCASVRQISLRWEQFDLKAGLLAVQRLKGGVPSTHPLRGPELRALRQLRREWPDSPYLFVSERGGPMTASNVRKLVTRYWVRPQSYRFRSTRTCYATPAAISSPMKGTTRDPCSTTSGTRILHTPFATRNLRRTDLNPFGGTNWCCDKLVGHKQHADEVGYHYQPALAASNANRVAELDGGQRRSPLRLGPMLFISGACNPDTNRSEIPGLARGEIEPQLTRIDWPTNDYCS